MNLVKLFLFVIPLCTVFFQNGEISGIINQYFTVMEINTENCNDYIQIENTKGLSIGQKILIIQMQGAEAIESNNSNFGKVIDYGSSGNFEFVSIKSIQGNIVILNEKLINSYNVNGNVQIVTIPKCENCMITGSVYAKKWDGSKGGVIVLSVEGTLTLKANIDATGAGFRGGNISNNPDPYCGLNSDDFIYPLFQSGDRWQKGGAMKGEGIVIWTDNNRNAGKGAIANGGGGGNKQNTGGGGGGNFTSGGKGGNELGQCAVKGNGGIGGYQLDYSKNKVFLGGGGGCGDANNNVGSFGTNGGGIIIIEAKEINGNGFKVVANGVNQTKKAVGIGDGAGGGGAGGSVIINTEKLNSKLFLEAKGGNGGNQYPTFNSCFGPGGGGGAGMISVNDAIKNDIFIEMKTYPGKAGKVFQKGLPCYDSGYGAENGDVVEFLYIPSINLNYGEHSDCGSYAANSPKPIVVLSNTVTIKIWDDKKEDGDEISVYLNNARIVNEIVVKNIEYVFTVELKKGKNIIKILAHNEGRISPNTAALIIDDGINEYRRTLSAKQGEYSMLELFTN